MKKNLILYLILVFVFVFGSLFLGQDVKGTSQETKKFSLEGVVQDKVWTIKLSAAVDPNSYKQHITVNDEHDKIVNVLLDLSKDEKTIFVYPPKDGYVGGITYALNVSGELRSSNGKKINQPVKKQFTILNLGKNEYTLSELNQIKGITAMYNESTQVLLIVTNDYTAVFNLKDGSATLDGTSITSNKMPYKEDGIVKIPFSLLVGTMGVYPKDGILMESFQITSAISTTAILNNQNITLKTGDKLIEEETIITGDKGEIILKSNDGSYIKLGAKSSCKILSCNRTKEGKKVIRIQYISGSISMQILNQGDGNIFRLFDGQDEYNLDSGAYIEI